MEGYSSWNTQDLDPADFDVDEVISILFQECDVKGKGKIRISTLIHFLRDIIGQELPQSMLQELQSMLDPQKRNSEVTKESLRPVIQIWTHQMMDNMPMNGKDMDYKQKSLQQMLISWQPDSPSNGMDLLSEKIEDMDTPPDNNERILLELRHTNKRQEEEIQELRTQLASYEENYTALQAEKDSCFKKLTSTQTDLQQRADVEKEYQGLREAFSLQKKNFDTLQTKLERMEKKNVELNENISKLENEKVELLSQIEGIRRMMSELQMALNQQRSELEEARVQVLRQKEVVDILTCQLNEEKSINGDLQIRIISLKEENQKLHFRVISAEDELLSFHSASSGLMMSMNHDDEGQLEESIMLRCTHSPKYHTTGHMSSIQAEMQASENKHQEKSQLVSKQSKAVQSLESAFQDQNLQNGARVVKMVDQSSQVTEEFNGTASHSDSEPIRDNEERYRWRKFRRNKIPKDLLLYDAIQLRPVPLLRLWEEWCFPSCSRKKVKLEAQENNRVLEDHLPMDSPDDKEMVNILPVSVPESPVATSTPRQTENEHSRHGSLRRSQSETQMVPHQEIPESRSFPSLQDRVLHQLGLVNKSRDALSQQDIETKFGALSLAFKTDKITLSSRYERQQRQRDQAECNMNTELTRLKTALCDLNRLCVDSDSVEILNKIKAQVDFLHRSTEMVSSSAELYGAVQQELRVSRAVDVMLSHVENLKRMYEKAHAELEETKRVLLENNIVVECEPDSIDEAQAQSMRYRSLIAGGKRVSKRRASIAAIPRPLGSPDSNKSFNTSSSSLTDGKTRIARVGAYSRRPSLNPSSLSDSYGTAWESTDRLDRAEGMSGMGDIKELVENRRESAAESEKAPSRRGSCEENNNYKAIAERRVSSSTKLEAEIPEDSLLPDTSTIDEDEEENVNHNASWLALSIQRLESFREFFTETVWQKVQDSILPLDSTYIIAQMRRFATLILLFAAVWSLLSTFFVPTTAHCQRRSPFTWYSLEELLREFFVVRNIGPRPT